MKYLIATLLLFNFIYSNSITIYSNNLAFIEESFDINLTKKTNKITIDNLPKTIISDSIFIDKLKVKLKEYIPKEENYIKSILDVNINSTVDFIFNKKLLRGKIVNKDPLTIKAEKKLYLIDDINKVIFYKEPKNRSASKLNVYLSESELIKEISLNYLLNSINWYANYIINLDKSTIDLNSWATITNSSGKSFKNYNLKLLSGELNRVSQRSRIYKERRVLKKSTTSLVANSIDIPTKSIANYYSYILPGKFNITKSIQVKLFEKNSIKYKNYGVAYNSRFSRYSESNLKFNNIIEFNNDNKSILPAGVARVFKDGYYVGESNIINTPKGEKIKLAIGTLYDAVGSSKVVEYIERNHYKKVTTQYKIKDRGSKKLLLILDEKIPHYGNKIVLKNQCKDNCSYKKLDAFRNRFTVELNPESSYEFNSTIEIFN